MCRPGRCNRSGDRADTVARLARNSDQRESRDWRKTVGSARNRPIQSMKTQEESSEGMAFHPVREGTGAVGIAGGRPVISLSSESRRPPGQGMPHNRPQQQDNEQPGQGQTFAQRIGQCHWTRLPVFGAAAGKATTRSLYVPS